MFWCDDRWPTGRTAGRRRDHGTQGWGRRRKRNGCHDGLASLAPVPISLSAGCPRTGWAVWVVAPGTWGAVTGSGLMRGSGRGGLQAALAGDDPDGNEPAAISARSCSMTAWSRRCSSAWSCRSALCCSAMRWPAVIGKSAPHLLSYATSESLIEFTVEERPGLRQAKDVSPLPIRAYMDRSAPGLTDGSKTVFSPALWRVAWAGNIPRSNLRLVRVALAASSTIVCMSRWSPADQAYLA
jgi:hypothetical protein